MKTRSTATPESSDRTRFLERAAAVAETTPATVTLMLAAGVRRIVVGGSQQPFDQRA